MTIQTEAYRYSGLYAGEVRCLGPDHATGSVRLYYIDHGLGSEAEPLNMTELEEMKKIAEAHDIATKGAHDIRVVLFEK